MTDTVLSEEFFGSLVERSSVERSSVDESSLGVVRRRGCWVALEFGGLRGVLVARSVAVRESWSSYSACSERFGVREATLRAESVGP